MKIMVISDIHGGIENLNKVIDIYTKEDFERLFVLGDLYNAFNEENNDQIEQVLNGIQNKVMVLGNCEQFVPPKKLRILADIYTTKVGEKVMVLTHGHRYNESYLLSKKPDFIFLGHTHKPRIDYVNGIYIVNPGSITCSREGENSFATVDNEEISIKSLDNNVIRKEKIKKA